MTFYDNTKEDSRPWRTVQDTQGQAIDDAAVAKAAVNLTDSIKQSRQNGIIVTPNPTTVTVGTPTRQLTATQVSNGFGTVTWVSSDPTKATVNASTGLVTRVANGTTVVTATASTSTGKGVDNTITGSVVVTVTA